MKRRANRRPVPSRRHLLPSRRLVNRLQRRRPGPSHPSSPEPGRRASCEHRRLRVDTRKWMLAKALPKIYGDKLTAEVTGKDGAPLNEPIDKVELARSIAFI